MQLIASANLPPLFIEEFLPGFAVVEHEGEIVGCGGLELYGDSGVIRSIVTDEAARGLGLGRRISELLIDDARAFGATDLYLFTMDAWEFWKHLGFVDVRARRMEAAAARLVAVPVHRIAPGVLGDDPQHVAQGVTARATAARITVRLTPRAGRDCIDGWDGDVLRVRVSAAPSRRSREQRVAPDAGEGTAHRPEQAHHHLWR